MKYRQEVGYESGGVITGSIISQDKYRISKISPKCTVESKASPCGCVRDAKLANDFITQDFEESNHTRYYFGEWHTHPEDNPHPSSVDIESIIEIYNKSDIVLDGVFLIIVGLKSNYYGFYNGICLKNVDIIIV